MNVGDIVNWYWAKAEFPPTRPEGMPRRLPFADRGGGEIFSGVKGIVKG